MIETNKITSVTSHINDQARFTANNMTGKTIYDYKLATYIDLNDYHNLPEEERKQKIILNKYIQINYKNENIVIKINNINRIKRIKKEIDKLIYYNPEFIYLTNINEIVAKYDSKIVINDKDQI